LLCVALLFAVVAAAGPYDDLSRARVLKAHFSLNLSWKQLQLDQPKVGHFSVYL